MTPDPIAERDVDTDHAIPLPATLPRLIATDLDGTLLRADKSVSPRTQRALAAAEDAGLHIVFVTGRPPRFMADVAEHVSRHGIALCSNGAAVYDLPRERLLRCQTLPAETALTVLAALRAAIPGIRFGIEFTSGFAYEPSYEILPNMPKVLGSGNPEQLIADAVHGDITKIVAQQPEWDPDDLLLHGRRAAEEHVAVTRSSPALEISAPGVSKAAALAEHCAELGIPARHVTAFGDMPNDLPMLAWAGTSYAVANAHPEVLDATVFHAPDHEDDGVARTLEAMLRTLT